MNKLLGVLIIVMTACALGAVAHAQQPTPREGPILEFKAGERAQCDAPEGCVIFTKQALVAFVLREILEATAAAAQRARAEAEATCKRQPRSNT